MLRFVISLIEFAASNVSFELLEVSEGLLNFLGRFKRAPAVTVINSVLELELIEIVVDEFLLQSEESKFLDVGVLGLVASGS